MNTELEGGAINPYALTETIVGKRIDWSKVEQPIELLEKTLQTPADRLFDGGKGSPVFALQDALLDSAPVLHSTKRTTEKQAISSASAAANRRVVPKLNLSSTISAQLQERLHDLITPVLPPEQRETEYTGATWSDPGDFFEEGAEFGDPVQGAVGDCWLIAALASVAITRPYAISHRNRTTGADEEAFVDLIEIADSSGVTRQFEVTEKVPVNNGSGLPRFARSAEAGEIWPCVYEKAFAKHRSGNLTDQPDILTLSGGSCVGASKALVPGTTAQTKNTASASADDLWKMLRDNCIATPLTSSTTPSLSQLRSGRTINPMTAWTYAKAEDAPDDIEYNNATGIVGWHCYSILGWITRRRLTLPLQSVVRGTQRSSLTSNANTTLDRYIVLRNPWGTHEGLVDTLGGHWDSHEISWTRSTPLNTKGVFAMSIESFKRYYAGMGVVS